MPTIPVDVGADVFAALDGKRTCIVRQINPDTGATEATSTGVEYISPDYLIRSNAVGDGEVGSTEDEFLLLASGISFVPKARDEIETEDGAVWIVGDVKVLAFGELYQCDGCVQQRG